MHVVLGRKDSSQLGWQGLVGQVDSVQQNRRAVVVLAPAVATQLEAADGIGGGDCGEDRQRCGYVREGLLRSVYTKPGIREDTQIWSRLPTDP